MHQILHWRQKVNYNSLDSKQKIAFNLKLGMRKSKGYKLTNFKGEINFSPVGHLINSVPSCLDPSVKCKTFERIVASQIAETDCLCELTNHYPIEMDFYPSDEVLEKLVMLSLKIKDAEQDLWEGFYQVTRQDGTSIYKPIELI